jgi:hypothetical protein
MFNLIQPAAKFRLVKDTECTLNTSKNVSWTVQLETSAGERYHYLKLYAENIQLTGQNIVN